MSLASHGGHGQVEILEVRPCPFDLGLGDGEEAGTGGAWQRHAPSWGGPWRPGQ